MRRLPSGQAGGELTLSLRTESRSRARRASVSGTVLNPACRARYKAAGNTASVECPLGARGAFVTSSASSRARPPLVGSRGASWHILLLDAALVRRERARILRGPMGTQLCKGGRHQNGGDGMTFLPSLTLATLGLFFSRYPTLGPGGNLGVCDR
jgi:hypothetical protein